jgi:hypothetical protein
VGEFELRVLLLLNLKARPARIKHFASNLTSLQNNIQKYL